MILGLSPFESRVIAVFTDVAKALALPKSYAEIYGLLYASAHPLAFIEVETKLQLSKGSVSQGLRSLRELGAVESSTDWPDRRERFAPVLELKKLVGAFLRERLQPQLQHGAESMSELPALLANAPLNAADRQLLGGRVAKLDKWRRKAAGILPLITKFLG